jgi:hypothetical protein
MPKPNTKDIFNFIIAPVMFLTVALAGGVRFTVETQELRFLAPQLVALILAAFAVMLFIRGGLVELSHYIGEHRDTLENASGAMRLASLYFATAQIFNAVTPERGLLNFCFYLFYFLIFWNNMFAVFNPVRLTKSLATVLAASFALKYLVLADLFAPTQSWAKYILQTLMQTASLGALDFETFAPATGYLGFATVALYIIALYLIAPRVDRTEELLYNIFIERYKLSPVERRRLLAAVAETALNQPETPARSLRDESSIDAEFVEDNKR